ncbi:MAG TPA: 1,6-anhydro-N-acetylmuramyl-L-alanine amidase AmpD [Cellvibrionaceae bacterium]
MQQQSCSSIINGWLTGAYHLPTVNCGARPVAAPIDLLVIHNISLPPGEFGTGKVQAFFTNCLDCSEHPYFAALADVQVSSHLLIERTGIVTQFVSFDDRAWHAGQSSFMGVDNCNDFSIGIELEGTDTLAYTAEQYQALVDVIRLLKLHYSGITSDRIVGHSDIAPGRKTDPGPAFEWVRLRAALSTTEGEQK